MLDAYIIDRIRRERERARVRREAHLPLRIEDAPRDRREREGPVEGDEGRRGSVVIDYTLL